MKTNIKYIILAVLSILIVLLSFLGINRGKDRAKAQAILENTKAIVSSLDFFYNDNNRFPTADEFANKELMQSYFSTYPDFQSWSSKNCAPAYGYTRPSARSYKLDFCLPASAEDYKAGWNEIVNSK